MSARNPDATDDIGYFHAVQLIGDSETIRVSYDSGGADFLDGEEYAQNMSCLLEDGEINNIERKAWLRYGDRKWGLFEELDPEKDIRFEIDLEIEWDAAETTSNYIIHGALSTENYDLELENELTRKK